MADRTHPISAVHETGATAPGDSPINQWLDGLRAKQVGSAPDTAAPAAVPSAEIAPPGSGKPVAPPVVTMHDLAVDDARTLAYKTNHRMEDASKLIPLAVMGVAGVVSRGNGLPLSVNRFLNDKASSPNRFTSLLAGEGGAAVLDHYVDDNLDHRFTNLNDLVVDPLIATRMRGNFALKAGVMLGTHIIGRVIDYFVHEDPAGALAEQGRKPETVKDLMDSLTGTPTPLARPDAPLVTVPPHKVEYNTLAGATTTDADRDNQIKNRARQLGVSPADIPFVNGTTTNYDSPKPPQGDPSVGPPGSVPKPADKTPRVLPPRGSLFF